MCRRSPKRAAIKDFDIALWQGFFAPRGTPREIVMRLHAEINKTLLLPDVQSEAARSRRRGDDDLDRRIRGVRESGEHQVSARIIKDGNLKPE